MLSAEHGSLCLVQTKREVHLNSDSHVIDFVHPSEFRVRSFVSPTITTTPSTLLLSLFRWLLLASHQDLKQHRSFASQAVLVSGCEHSRVSEDLYYFYGPWPQDLFRHA